MAQEQPEEHQPPKPLRLQSEYLELRKRQRALRARGQDAAASITEEVIAYIRAHKEGLN